MTAMTVSPARTLPLLLALLGACTQSTTPATDSSAEPAREAAQFPSGWRLPAGASSTFASHAMAVSNSPEASAAAAEMMKAGGNAVDAAVALKFHHLRFARFFVFAKQQVEQGRFTRSDFANQHEAPDFDSLSHVREISQVE